MTGPAYPAARAVANCVADHFAQQIAVAHRKRQQDLVEAPDPLAVEAIIDATFWASLRREEGYSPKISLAFVPPELTGPSLLFDQPLPLNATALSRVAPSVERPGIHLGVRRHSNELCVWGITHTIPRFCMVVEVVEPGLLVVKYRRGQDPGKLINIVVLEGDQIKMVDERGTGLADCPSLVTSMLGFTSVTSPADSVNVLVQLAVSMRTHGRGGALLVVPRGSDEWLESIVRPLTYLMSPPYAELAELVEHELVYEDRRQWQESLRKSVENVGGLTAVDGAALITEQYELLAFGAKIQRRDGGAPVEQVILTEPVIDSTPSIFHPVQLGGTRHLSAAQFVHDQRNSVALVASQDGRFTVFAWSPCEEMVHAHRVEALLL